ncbi:MAG: effector-associated domain EAD1-containing protein [Caldilineaceae bacterium]
MPLSGDQLRQIRDALLSAFPSGEDLAMMIRLNLDESLEVIAGNGNLSVVAFNLLIWAESKGLVSKLLAGAVNDSPDNPLLNRLIQDARDWGLFKQSEPKSTPESKDEQKKALYLSLQQRIHIGLPYVRLLWPLQIPGVQVPPRNDANFDFPSSIDEIDNKGVESNYQISTTVDEIVNGYDICQRYLSLSSHHVISGARYAGKSWLRQYLEYYLLGTSTTGDEPLITFYFAPITLTYRHNEIDIILSMARSIANQIFANLLLKTSQSLVDRSWGLKQCEALAPFFQQYGYSAPTKGAALAHPAPDNSIVDLDVAYGNSELSVLYAAMKQEVDFTPLRSNPLSSISKEQVLDDIHSAMEVAHYSKVFLLVDNWDRLASGPRNRLLTDLLAPDLLTHMQERKLYMKVFMHEFDASILTSFHHVCDVQRTVGKPIPSFSIYAYP